ncbi:hypothetical protein K0T92_11435 [Paenibacillus oenotherae]|uniref:Uncharacterized protein n=1 Tax=Paenibacillus oenotherae TaxID=1435645 RepID=A0ABS7D744_9BACL|nr:hypothetical protein [Paenibacillus oenotherae]MBW7475362.1 hypothetical protein [Paenibacillus oenotherae]
MLKDRVPYRKVGLDDLNSATSSVDYPHRPIVLGAARGSKHVPVADSHPVGKEQEACISAGISAKRSLEGRMPAKVQEYIAD